jgi:hypothetical protein
LAVALWVARRAAVPQPDVEVAVGPEGQHAAVVIGIWLVHKQKALFAVWVRPVRIVILNLVPCDDGIAILIRIVEEELAVLGEARVKCNAQQTLLGSAAAHAIADV